jgi:hypothetical protein
MLSQIGRLQKKIDAASGTQEVKVIERKITALLTP